MSPAPSHDLTISLDPGSDAGRALAGGGGLARALGEMYGLVPDSARSSDGGTVLRRTRGQEASVRVIDARPTGEPTTPRAVVVSLSDDPAVPEPFRGRRIPELLGDRPFVPAPGEVVLASCDGGALWTRSVAPDGSEAHRVAVPPPGLDSGTLLEAFRPGRFVGLLPLLAAARATRGSLPLPAAIQIDDPNLHATRYGFLDYRDIGRLARAAPFHVVMATIPLDAWRTSRAAAREFAAGGLSLCVHGNDHVSRELGRERTDAELDRLLVQALGRIARLERASGIRVSRVMAPPHGACAANVPRALVRSGFSALTISRPRPWGPPPADADDVLLGARRAELVDGLPLIRRIHVDDIDLVPFAAFLEQPLVVYGHHWDWPGGADDLAATAARIDGITPTAWGPLEDAVRHGVETWREGTTLQIRMYGRDATVEVPADASDVTVLPEERHPADALDTATVVSTVREGRSSPEILLLRLTASDTVRPATTRSPPRSLLPIARRLLTESRDRLQPVRAGGRGRGRLR
jgi:hypothetical protein